VSEKTPDPDPDPCGAGGQRNWQNFTYTNTDGVRVTARRCSKCKIED
jgi:hypothetical protein